MILKNSVCYEVSIQVEELVYESAEGAERALLLLKVVFEEEVTHCPSVIKKDFVNEISR